MSVSPFYPLDLDAIPRHWEVALLSDVVVEMRPGFASGQHNRLGTGVPHLRPMNVSPDGHLDLADLKYVNGANALRVQRGDVLFNNTNSPQWVGKTAVIHARGDLAFSNHMTRIRVGSRLHPEFLALQLHYLCLSGYFRQTCTNHVNQASVSLRDLRLLPVIVPPVDEQGDIVLKIDEQLTRLDSAARSLGAYEARSAKLASTVLQACLAGGVFDMTRPDQPTLVRLPNTWKACVTRDVVTEARYGTSTKCDHEGRGVSVVRIPNIRDRRIDWSDMKHAVDIAEDLSRLYVRSGDVLVIRTNGSRSLIGKVGLVEHDRNAAFASYLVRLKPDITQINPAYLAAILSSPSYRAVIEARAATTAGQYNLSIPALMSLPVPVPPLETQVRLVAEVERWESVIESVARSFASASHRAKRLRGAILNAAFTGKLVRAAFNAQTGAVLPTRLIPTATEVSR